MPFAIWYAGSYLLSRLGANLFNFGFYWRVKMLSAESPFWTSFRDSFVAKFKNSFRSIFQLIAKKEPTDKEINEQLSKFVLGLGPDGFLTSALYKATALLLVNAVTFGWFIYPLLPASVGGGKTQNILLVLSADKSPGLLKLGVLGEPTEIKDQNEKGGGARFLTKPLSLLAKTSEAYFVLAAGAAGTTVVKIPMSSVEGVSYQGAW